MSKIDFVGERIKDLRLKRNLTQTELAEMVGYKSGRAMICQIESGQVNLPLDKLKALAVALGTTPAYLAGYEDATQDEELLISYFRTLNSTGKQNALEYMRMLSNNPIFTNSDIV